MRERKACANASVNKSTNKQDECNNDTRPSFLDQTASQPQKKSHVILDGWPEKGVLQLDTLLALTHVWHGKIVKNENVHAGN